MENEPLFRKGDLLIWSGYSDKHSKHYRRTWPSIPFKCAEDVYGPNDIVHPLGHPKRAAFAKRFTKAVFLNAVKEALAEHDNA